MLMRRLVVPIFSVGVTFLSAGVVFGRNFPNKPIRMFSIAPGVAPYLKSGELKGLAVTSAQPSALVPGLPTIAASGLPGYESILLQGIFAPAKTPAAIIGLLNREIVRLLYAG